VYVSRRQLSCPCARKDGYPFQAPDCRRRGRRRRRQRVGRVATGRFCMLLVTVGCADKDDNNPN